jgi:hypothetical protein
VVVTTRVVGAFLLAAAIAACSPTSVAPPDQAAQSLNRVTVSVSPDTASVQVGGNAIEFTAAVSGASDSSVSWEVDGVAGGDSTVGTISAAGSYLSPAKLPSAATVTITAVSMADSTASGTATLSLTAPSPPPPNIAVAISPITATLATGGVHLSFVATVTGASDSALTWQVNGITGGNGTIGTISSTGVYQTPQSVPSPAAVTITAISVQDATKSGSATVTLTSSTGSSPIKVSVTPATASVAAGGVPVAFSATVTGTSNTGVTWSVNGVTGGSGTVGTITAAGGYLSPPTVPTPATVTVTAVSAADPSQSKSATVTVTAAAPAVTVSVSPSIASVRAGTGTQAFVATVKAATNTAVTWAVNGMVGGNSTVGKISSGGVYTAPVTAPAQPTVTVTATSVQDTTKSGKATVTVTTASTAPPTISGKAPTAATAGHAYSFMPTASSPRGAALTFSIANKPSWANFSATTGALTGTPATTDVGTFANIQISVGDGTASASLAPFTISVQAAPTASVTLSWVIPTTRTDGTALTNLAGFNIYYGNAINSYPIKISVANPTLSTFVVTDLPTGATYYFVATTYDASGNESAHTNPVSTTL